MIERPFTASVADKFPKILNLFRQMQLRQLIVVNDSDGTLQGIITRKDLFQYMSL
jgi:CBS domain-containing protein